MDSKKVKSYFFIVLVIILLILVIFIFKRFLAVFLWAAVFAVFVHPVYQLIINRWKKTLVSTFLKHLIAGTLSIVFVLIIFIPMSYLVYQLVIELKDFFNWFQEFLKSNSTTFLDNLNIKISDWIYSVSSLKVKIDIQTQIINLLESQIKNLTSFITSTLSKTVNFITYLFFTIITLYFYLTDGDVLLDYFKKAIPIDSSVLSIFFSKLTVILKNIVKGYLLVALYQAVVSFIIFSLFKTPNPVLFSFLIFFASFIPMIGATGVWLPVAIIVGLTESWLKAIYIFLLCGIFISTFDNLLRPLILSGNINLHPLLLFFAIIGGIMAFGFNGLILGPLLLALLYSSLEIFQSM